MANTKPKNTKNSFSTHIHPNDVLLEWSVRMRDTYDHLLANKALSKH